MYNNEITYDKKFDTPENLAALDKLDKKYFDDSYCAPSCPVSWAPEVLELMETLDRELGIEKNDSTLRAYFPQGNMIQWFVTNPISGFFGAINTYIIKKVKIRDYDSDSDEKSYRSRTLLEKLSAIYNATLHPIKYGFRVLKITKVNKILNKINKPRLRLTQLKEKYGSLRIYFECSPAFNEWVEEQIRITEIKLAIKGAYYPIESFYDSGTGYSVGTEYNPDTIISKEEFDANGKLSAIYIKETKYRKIMKELGVNLEDVKLKAEARKAEKQA